MNRHLTHLRRTLLTSCALLTLSAAPALAYDQMAEADTVAPTPLYAPGSVTPSVQPAYISPLAPVAMPDKPLYPERTRNADIPAPQIVTAPVPLTPATATTAATPMSVAAAPASNITYYPANGAPQVETAAPVAVAQPLAAPASGFVAPAPVLAMSPQDLGSVPATPAPVKSAAAVKPIVVAQPVAAPATPTPLVASAQPELKDQTRGIISHIPSAIDKPVAPAGGKVTLQRVSPEVKDSLPKPKEETYENAGISIKVSRPGLDTNFELNRAYTSLMGGDTQAAIETYKNILSTEPNNEDALFGLAATYHRLGDVEKARPLYGQLLKVNPNHREGLNNFLVMVSDESPADALPELERLEQRNPDFSPIPAQEAIVLDKLGFPDRAQEKMLRAIDLAPDNLSYQYNLAVMLDQHGHFADAAGLYDKLIRASLEGAKIPASTEAMQKRLTYLVTEATKMHTGMAVSP